MIDVCNATLTMLCIHMIHIALPRLPIFGQELLICSMSMLQSVGHSRTALNDLYKPNHKALPLRREASVTAICISVAAPATNNP